HTRFSRDWSSDVCSSDLFRPGDPCGRAYQKDVVEARSGRAEETKDLEADCLFCLRPPPVGLFRPRCRATSKPSEAGIAWRRSPRSEERRVGKEGRSPWCA